MDKRLPLLRCGGNERRPEIVEDFEREVIGRVPPKVPPVTWTVVSNVTDGLVGKLPASGKRLVGHVDNSACPAITVDIRMSVVFPKDDERTGPCADDVWRVRGRRFATAGWNA